jgi:UPF0755 protein
MKKILVSFLLLGSLMAFGLYYWAGSAVFENGPAIPFTIKPGSSLSSTAQQIEAAGVPMQANLFNLLGRLTGKGNKLKAGSYEIKPGTSPLRLLDQLARGEFAQETVTIIEGWTFKQMRAALNQHPGLKHDTADLSDRELMARIAPEYEKAEGLFFPDTYLFAKGASDWQIYKQAHLMLQKRLTSAWEQRDKNLPYQSAYQALIMASIVEKETGKKSERGEIAGVFVNRLRLGMLLQTDPTVIYGMGERYQGKIYKRDLETDTPYNTYTRPGLPPTPIALPGVAALSAALGPNTTSALYFVSRNDGSSQFSDNLSDHNRAVNKYQRQQTNK